MKRKLQVFVSSTYTDLLEERQAAVSAILKSGHIPAGMELFTSGNISQMETIKKWIDESDVYMLILGARYGSLEPTTGVSYTELEYDYAVQQGKALFAVVIDEHAIDKKVKDHGRSVLEQENPQLLKLFREKVLSNISSFFEDPKDIKLCIHESLSDYSSDKNMMGWVPANEIYNSQQLLDEISSLRKDNDNLIKKLEEAENKITMTENFNEEKVDYQKLMDILSKIEIKVPENLIGDSDIDMNFSLLDLFYRNRNQLIIGVDNSMNSGDLGMFIYHNVAPKLQVYDLVLHEKVDAVQWRRFIISAKGLKLIAHIEKLEMNYNQKKDSNQDDSTGLHNKL